MPTISVFIRKDDLDKFKALPNKSEFLHNALNFNVFHTHPMDILKQGQGGRYNGDSPIGESFVGIEPELVPPVEKTMPREYDGKLCKHGHPPTFCKFAKPGKPCK